MVGFIDASSSALSYVGAAIILYGGAIATLQTINLEAREPPGLSYLVIRRDFTHRVVFALDFLVAGDIMRTIVTPSREEVFLLGSIVAIRTVMGYFLTKEVRDFEAATGKPRQPQ